MGRRIETEPRPMTLSKEFVSDSSDEEVDGPFTSPPQTKKASAAHEQQQQDHAENSDVGDSSEIVTAAATSSDESSSEKENGNEVASRSKKQIKPRSRKKAPPNPPQKSVPAVVAAIPPKPYQPPNGFAKSTSGVSDTSSALSVLSNVENRQVWYITAPASLPLASLQEFSMNAIGQGTPIMSYRGREYGISKAKMQAAKQETVLRPSGDAGILQRLPLQFSQSYQIYELPINAPKKDSNTTHTPLAAAEVVSGRYAKPVRQQPPGLRMRYQPFGTQHSTAAEVKESDGEEDGFRMPRQLASPPVESPKKKRKKQQEAPPAPEVTDVMDVDESQAPDAFMSEKLDLSQASTAQANDAIEPIGKAEKKARSEEKERKKKKKRQKQSQEG